MTSQYPPDATWRSLLVAPKPGDGLKVQRLIEEFRDVEQHRSELGGLAGPRYRNEAGHRWLPYKEAFSPGLVRTILDSWSGVEGLLLDPFAGSGTSLLVAGERGMDAIGVELLPYARWAADTVVRAHTADVTTFRDLTAGAAAAGRVVRVGAQAELPVPAASWALSEEVSSALLALRDALPARGTRVEADLAHLALMSVVESVSAAVKDGTSLRHRARERAGRTTRPGRKGQQLNRGQVVDAFVAAAQVVADDLPKMPGATAARVLMGDARHLPLRDAAADCAVFSPPYPNRYDYSALYQLELAVGGFVRVPEELRRIRKALLRSHRKHRRRCFRCWTILGYLPCCGQLPRQQMVGQTSGAGLCGCWSATSMTCVRSWPSSAGCCGRGRLRHAWWRRRPISATQSRPM